MTFVLITFVAPPVRILLLVYFELVAQAHFTPPSFTSFLDDFNSRILLSLLKKTLVCPTLCIALIGTQFPPFQFFIASHTFAILHNTLSFPIGTIRPTEGDWRIYTRSLHRYNGRHYHIVSLKHSILRHDDLQVPQWHPFNSSNCSSGKAYQAS